MQVGVVGLAETEGGAGVKLRDPQPEAVGRILEAFGSGTRTVFLDAPVGSGKSAIHLWVGRELGGMYLTTPQTMLVDQYARDTENGAKFSGYAAAIKGRRGYPCPHLAGDPSWGREGDAADTGEIQDVLDALAHRVRGPTADGAPCTFLRYWPIGMHFDPQGGKTWHASEKECNALCEPGCPVHDDCPYYAALSAAREHTSTVTTLAYLFTSHVEKKWGHRPLLVIDEAHKLAEDLVRFYAVEVGPETFPGMDYAAFDGAWDKARILREFLPAYIDDQKERLEFMQGRVHKPATRPELKRLRKQQALVERAERVDSRIKFAGVDWVWTPEPATGRHQGRPMTVRPFIGDFWHQFDRVLLSSATFLGIPTLARDIALPEGWTVVTVPDTFPAASAPIRLLGSVRLTKRTWAAERPRVVAEIDRLVADHPDERGMVHCNSYQIRDAIRELAPPRLRDRLAFHERGDRNDRLLEWMDDGSANSVLVGVAMAEGLDLAGDLARFQIVVKAPFPNKGDPWVVRRMNRPDDGDDWYMRRALVDIMQASGRIMRSREDRGTTYVIDVNATALVREYWTSLPPWFRARVEAGRAT